MSVSHHTQASRPVILIVDDYVDALPAWEIFLRSEGFDVITASTGPDALGLAIRVLPDLIVMDLVLPGLSGNEVARALRSEDRTRRIPLIAATGVSGAAPLEQARDAGFEAILVKPVDPALLVATIRKLLADLGRLQHSI